MTNKLNVAVIFGSRSVEHEVSIVTAMQLFEEIDRGKYRTIPVYIDKNGEWLTGEKLEKLESFKNLGLLNRRGLTEYFLPPLPHIKALLPVSGGFLKRPIPVDVIFPVIHGTLGEDGTLQGLLEMAAIPYVGCGVTASAIGMDKVIQKAVFEKAGLPVGKYLWFTREEWEKDSKAVLKSIEETIPYPLFVKPANLGSSVAVHKATDKKSLTLAVEVAKTFDRKILVEQGFDDAIEINCSVLGFNQVEASVCEQPLKEKDLLSYEDKYLKGGKVKGMAGLSRLVPAPISKTLAAKIQEMSKVAFKAIDGAGISRVDFFVYPKTEKIYVNEINTLPGSLAFYLWEKSGLSFPKLIDRLIDLAFERFESLQKITYAFDSKLLQSVSKGTKV